MVRGLVHDTKASDLQRPVCCFTQDMSRAGKSMQKWWGITGEDDQLQQLTTAFTGFKEGPFRYALLAGYDGEPIGPVQSGVLVGNSKNIHGIPTFLVTKLNQLMVTFSVIGKVCPITDR
jgi:hypothetical protein